MEEQVIQIITPLEVSSNVEGSPKTYNEPGEIEYSKSINELQQRAISSWRSYQARGGKTELEQTISHFESVLHACPSDHLYYVSALNNLAGALLELYRHNQDLEVLSRSNNALRQCLELYPTGRERVGPLSNLATGLLEDFGRTGNVAILAEACELYQEAIALLAQDSPNYALLESNLSNALRLRYEKTGNVDYLTKSIDSSREALQSPTMKGIERAGALRNLGAALSTYSQHLDNRDPLSEATLLFKESLELYPNDHPARSVVLGNLITTLKRIGTVDSLGETVQLESEILHSRPHGHPDREPILEDLSKTLKARVELASKERTPYESIQMLRDALQAIPRDHPNYIAFLDALAHALYQIALQSRDQKSLSESIDLFRKVLDSRPSGHPARANTINRLAQAVCLLFRIDSKLETLEEAIGLSRKALVSFPNDSSKRDELLHDLAFILDAGYDRKDELPYLKEAVSLYRQSLELRGEDHPQRAITAARLGVALRHLGERTKDRRVLEESVQIHRELLQKSTLDRSHALELLGNSLVAKYRHDSSSGNTDILDEAINVHRESVQVLPEDSTKLSERLGHLGFTLLIRFQHLGLEEDLAEATQAYRESLRKWPPEAKNRDIMLSGLANALLAFAIGQGDSSALNECIQLLAEAWRSLPEGHPRGDSIIINMDAAMLVMYSANHEAEILDQIINVTRGVLKRLNREHPDRVEALSNLAYALSERHELNGQLKDLEEAITLSREAVELDSPTNQMFSIRLNNLGQNLEALYLFNGNTEALREAIDVHIRALALHSEGSWRRATTQASLSRLLLADTPHFSWDDALQHLNSAATDSQVSARQRLSYGIRALTHAERAYARAEPSQSRTHASQLLQVYIHLVHLLPRVANVGLDLSNRMIELRESGRLCRVAASRAILLDQPHTAIEAVEEGKTVFWSQSLRPRAREFDLVPPSEEKEELMHIFKVLEDESHFSPRQKKDRPAVERNFEERRRLNARAGKLIEKIRSQQGLERFMSVPSIDVLAQAASRGPVVILLATEHACFALIILDASGATKSVPLDLVTLETLRELCDNVPASGLKDRKVRRSREDEAEHRGMHKTAPGKIAKAKQTEDSHQAARPPGILAKLWTYIVRPVVLALGLTKAKGRQRPRVHWCPMGDFTFLPLHAAGIYSGNALECASDFFVSSYTPSLSALIRAREGYKSVSRSQLKALLVAESDAPGLEPLYRVRDEVYALDQIIHYFSGIVLNDLDSVPTVEEILLNLPDAHILHLSCHGQQVDIPLQSCFALRDGPLTISSLMETNLPNAVLAFLSACETARGDRQQPDQAVHLAASMLFCGFRSVIATMWTMGDDDGPFVAPEVYQELLAKEEFDLDDIPYALDNAISKLRDSGVEPSRWATFIHIGA